jgi:integrase
MFSTTGGLHLRSIDALEARTILGPDALTFSAFYSPDGQAIGYWADGQLKRISLNGGAPVVICEAALPFGISWERDNTILFGQSKGIMRVSANGGTPELVIPAKEGERIDGPRLLPNPKQRLTTENPFELLDKQKGERHRETRITDEQQAQLIAVCQQWMTATRTGSDKPNKRLRRSGHEMYRRLLAAFDTGLRSGEMGLVQVKHIDYANWRITLPWANAKGGKTTGRDEYVWVMSERLRTVLEQRRFLGADGYVFGTEDGRHVKSFHGTWRALYREAGLPDHLIWHDARHEFVSSLIEEGGTVQEVKGAARHKSITTTARYMKAHDERLKALLERRANRLKAAV